MPLDENLSLVEYRKSRAAHVGFSIFNTKQLTAPTLKPKGKIVFTEMINIIKSDKHKIYIDYINNSLEWKIKKQEFFSNKPYKCESCGTTKDIQVHHGTYDRLYKEEMTDLFALCNKCHTNYHNSIKGKTTIRKTLNFIKGDTEPISTNNLNIPRETHCGAQMKLKINTAPNYFPFYRKCLKCRKVFFPKKPEILLYYPTWQFKKKGKKQSKVVTNTPIEERMKSSFSSWLGKNKKQWSVSEEQIIKFIKDNY